MKDLWILALVALGLIVVSQVKKTKTGEWSPELLADIKKQNQALMTYDQEDYKYMAQAMANIPAAAQQQALAAIKAGADPLAITQAYTLGGTIDQYGIMIASG